MIPTLTIIKDSFWLAPMVLLVCTPTFLKKNKRTKKKKTEDICIWVWLNHIVVQQK